MKIFDFLKPYLFETYTIILTAFSSSITIFVTSAIKKRRNGKLKDATFNQMYINSKLQEVCLRLEESYGCDRVLIYSFHNGISLPNGLSWKETSAIAEAHHPQLTSKMKDHQKLPLTLLGFFAEHYKNKDIFKVFDIVELQDKYLKRTLESDGIKSTYSVCIFDKNEIEIGVIVINFIFSPKRIKDFSELKIASSVCSVILDNKPNSNFC